MCTVEYLESKRTMPEAAVVACPWVPLPGSSMRTTHVQAHRQPCVATDGTLSMFF